MDPSKFPPRQFPPQPLTQMPAPPPHSQTYPLPEPATLPSTLHHAPPPPPPTSFPVVPPPRIQTNPNSAFHPNHPTAAYSQPSSSHTHTHTHAQSPAHSPLYYPQNGYTPTQTNAPYPTPSHMASPNLQQQQQQQPSVPMQQRVTRIKTIKRAVAIRGGKLVVDLEVSPDLIDPNKVKYTQGEEFTKLRYTAVSCDPNDFTALGYQLRPALYNRKTELFIVVTMYNEDEILFTKTMQAINKNIQHMCNKKEGPFSGEHGWKKIVVCIVSDGRQKINKGVLTVLATMGCYQEGVCVPKFMNKETQAHLFEFTTQINVTSTLSMKTARDGVVPVQMLFCLKEKNQKKINSHRWFFNAFAPVLQPNVCVLVDVGTKPRRESIYRLWRCFDSNAQVGGACGEIAVEYNSIFHLLKPIIAAQNFEYKMSNILDKPLESLCGYISVLPGAFSAYRYKALLGRPLEQYFRGEKLHDSGDVFAANMYLAEDRILCFELIAKRNENWILKYEMSSQALTDVPDNFPEFISQRRRWLNGSTFALLYALGNVFQVFTSGHSFLRVVVLTFEFLYMALSFVFNYFALANYYLAYYFLSTGFVEIMTSNNTTQNGTTSFWGFPSQAVLRELLKSVLGIFRSIYILSLCTTFISALGNRPQAAKYIYLFAINLFAIITGFMFYMIIVTTAMDFPDVTKLDWSLSNAQTFRFLVTLISIASTYGVYFLSSFLYREPWHMFTSFIQYMFLLPTYINVLQIYAYCNISDVTWGTKGDNKPSGDAGVQVKTGSDGQALADVELPSQHPQDVQFAYHSRVQALNALKSSKPVSSSTQFSSEDYFKQFRTIWLLIWIIFNGGLVSVLVAPNVMGIGISPGRYYLNGLFVAITIFSILRFLGSLGYLFQRGLCCFCRSRGNA